MHSYVAEFLIVHLSKPQALIYIEVGGGKPQCDELQQSSAIVKVE